MTPTPPNAGPEVVAWLDAVGMPWADEDIARQAYRGEPTPLIRQSDYAALEARLAEVEAELAAVYAVLEEETGPHGWADIDARVKAAALTT